MTKKVAKNSPKPSSQQPKNRSTQLKNKDSKSKASPNPNAHHPLPSGTSNSHLNWATFSTARTTLSSPIKSSMNSAKTLLITKKIIIESTLNLTSKDANSGSVNSTSPKFLTSFLKFKPITSWTKSMSNSSWILVKFSVRILL